MGGFIHPVDPEGLSLKQVLSVINLMAKFHAIGSAKVNKCHKQMKLRHPYLLSNVYSSPTMIEGAQNMFSTYLQFLRSVPGQHHLVETFERHCAGEEGAKLMYSCSDARWRTPSTRSSTASSGRRTCCSGRPAMVRTTWSALSSTGRMQNLHRQQKILPSCFSPPQGTV